VLVVFVLVRVVLFAASTASGVDVLLFLLFFLLLFLCYVLTSNFVAREGHATPQEQQLDVFSSRLAKRSRTG